MIKSFLTRKKSSADKKQQSESTSPPDTGSNSLESSSIEFADELINRQQKRYERQLQRDSERNAHRRSDARLDCFTIATLVLPDSQMSLDGVVQDVSKHGVAFRPASRFIEHREGEHVQLQVEGVSRVGIIRATRPNGYGIQLIAPFTSADLSLIEQATLDINDMIVA